MRYIEETEARAVPDFARWVPPTEEERGAGRGSGGGFTEGAGHGIVRASMGEAGFGSAGDGIEQPAAVTLMLMAQGGQSNVQNAKSGMVQIEFVAGKEWVRLAAGIDRGSIRRRRFAEAMFKSRVQRGGGPA